MSIPVRQIVFPDSGAAISALEAVGARHEPALDLATEIAGLGKVHRRFGVMRHPLRGDSVADTTILAPFRALLGRPENARILDRITREGADYCPANKRILDQIRPQLLVRRLHLPWALRPMNMDFMALASKLHRARPFPFTTIYSEQVQVSPGPPPEVTSGRLFSLPLSGLAERTLIEPDEDDSLDSKVGLILEAHALVS
jgi:hypothetical protein